MPFERAHEEQPAAFLARYGDGATAARLAAWVVLGRDGLEIHAAGATPVVWRYADLRASEPIRDRSFDAVLSAHGAGNASLFVDDTLLLARLIGFAPQIKIRNERWRAARPGLTAGASALSVAAAIWALDLSPAKGVASTMPQRARVVLGESVIRTMPATRRCSNVDGYAALGALTQRLMPKGPVSAADIVVLDLKGGDGKPLINAFAVPGNKIVLTRAIIEQAQSPDELAAIIGHEAGHIIELHPETSLVRSVGFWALVQMVFTGTPGAISNVGVMLAQLGYTRVAEREADGHALRLLREAQISPKGMADFFRRMDKRFPIAKTQQGSAANDLLSSHPSNPERIARIDGVAAYASTAALDDAAWKKLQGICATSDVVPPSAPQPGVASNDKPDAAATATRAAAEKRTIEAKALADRARAESAAAAVAAATMAAGKVEADRIEAARLTSVARAAEIEAQRVASALAEAERTAAEARQKLALATGVPPVPVPAERPGPTPFDTRIANASQRLATNATDVAALFERGQAYSGKGELASAIGDFSRVLALKPADSNTYFWRASVYTRLNELDLAIADYSEVLKLQPRNFAAFNNRGSLYKSQKKLDLAMRDYTEAVAIDGAQAIALTNRALIHRERRNLDQAIADLNAAIAANPNYVNAYVRRGETYELKSARDAAIADYRAAIKLPDQAASGPEPRQTARARLSALGVNF